MKTELLSFVNVKQEESLKIYNTFRIGGICKYMIEPVDIEELKRVLKYVKDHQMKFFLLGNGSNVILNDAYYDGVVIRLNHFDSIHIENDRAVVGAGVMLPKLAQETLRQGYTGFEWACGIPGTVGGAVFGNAEAYKESTFDSLLEVLVLTPQLEVKTLKKEELTFAYRTSCFKESPGNIILISECW